MKTKNVPFGTSVACTVACTVERVRTFRHRETAERGSILVCQGDDGIR